MKRTLFHSAVAALTFILGLTSTLLNSPTQPRTDEGTAPVAVKSAGAPFRCETEEVLRVRRAVANNPADAYKLDELGDAYIHSGCYEEAASAFREAINMNPSYVTAYDDLANAYNALSRYEDALEVSRNGLAVEPQEAYLYNEMGYAYEGLDQYQLALDAFQQAIKAEPDNSFAHGTISGTYADLKRNEEATAEIKKAISLGTKDEDDAALGNAGFALLDMGEMKPALDVFELSLRYKKDVLTYSAMGKIYAITGKPDQASANFSRAASATPETPDDYLERGWVNLYLGNRAAALADAERYLTDTSWKGHSAPYAALLAHRVYRLSSRDNEARSIIDEAVAKCDKSDWTQNIFQYLQRKLTASELVALASNERERAEAHAYVGFNASLEGRTSEATSHLQWVRDRGKKGAIIYIFALKELEQRREG